MRLVLLASIVAAPAFAAEPPSPTVLTVTGEPGWEMTCHVWSKGQDEYVRFLDKGTPGLSAPNVKRLECAYKAGSRGPITIKVASPTLACPFKGATEASCESTLQKRKVGSFEILQTKGA